MSCQTTNNKRSPKFCLLLKTLLFLLCIYIKRVTSVSFSPASLGANVADALEFSEKIALEGENMYQLLCPVNGAVLLKDKTYLSNNKSVSQHYLKQLRNDTVRRVQVQWLKNNEPVFRENGNFVMYPTDPGLKTGSNVLTMLMVGPSDQGRYSCILNYTNAPKEASKFFNLHPRIDFDFIVEDSSMGAPNKKPIISHPPFNQLVLRGVNVTFTCNRMETLSHQTTFWFRSCPYEACDDRFLRAYNESLKADMRSHLERFMLREENGQELHIFNVSDRDIGYYGCLVQNNLGIDIRLARLDLIEKFISHVGSKINNSQNIVGSATAPTPSQSTTYFVPVVHHPGIQSNQIDTEVRSSFNATDLQYMKSAIPKAVLDSKQPDYSWYVIVAVSAILVSIAIAVGCTFCIMTLKFKRKKLNQHSLIMPDPIVGSHSICSKSKLRQHLPRGDCPDIYNIGKTSDGFISGQHHQATDHLMSQSVCNQLLNRENNPSISSSNTNHSDEASSWGKSMSSSTNGDCSRAFYHHTSNTTTTTVPMYDHPPSTRSAAQLCGAIVQDACVINPTYGFLRPETDATNWAFPRRNLERLNKIGEGQFGEVWKYIAHQKDGSKSFVAVKQLKKRVGLGDRERLELIGEIEIMKLVDNHPNVIKLLHYCADDYEPILLIMEYAENGKLQTYLRTCRSFRKPYGCISDTLTSITSKELLKFSYHIAKGMEYIASMGIIHRDLASRNILVSKDKVCKIADFGFARRVTDDCAYERTSADPVPVKWMAPESLTENKFTSKSDIFSLGILMWEIVTLGATPYAALSSEGVIKTVTSGGRLEKPVHCKDEFYNLMARCWLHDPSERPSFKELAFQLEKLLLSENDYIELDQYPEHAYYNILDAAEKEVVTLTP